MKKLALLMFAILILGCGTETPMVEEPPPIIEKPSPVVVSGEHLRIDIDFPALVWGSVQDGEENVDPDLIKAAGLSFGFNDLIRNVK